MSSWKTVSLGDVAEIFNGKTPSKGEQRGDGHPVLKIKDVSEFGEFRGSFESFVDHEFAVTFASKQVRKGDTLILNAAHNAEYVGSKTYRAQPPTFGALATGEWLIVRPVAAKLHPSFTHHWVNSPRTRRLIRDLVKGIHLYPKDASRLTISLPPLPEQQRIAEILDKADALRTKRRAALAELDTLTHSIFLDLFGNPIANPRGWPMKKFSALGSLDRGVSKHRPRNAPELLGGPYPFVQTGDVANCNGYIRDFRATYSEAGLGQSKMWPAGTLCITIAANIAKTGILAFDACFPDSVVGFRAKEAATVEFVRCWLSFLQASLEDKAPESAQKNINLEILRNLDVPTPKSELRLEFARRIAAVESLKGSGSAALAKADVLFASLQHRAFRGEL